MEMLLTIIRLLANLRGERHQLIHREALALSFLNNSHHKNLGEN